MAKLNDAAQRYAETKTAHEQASAEAREAVLAALKAGHPVPEVAKSAPFTYAYVRSIAEKNGIPRDERKARYPKPGKEIYEAVRLLPRSRIDELASRLESTEPAWYERTVARVPAFTDGNVPIDVNGAIVAHALADGKLTAEDLPAL